MSATRDTSASFTGIEAEVERRRAALTTDLELLGTMVAPEAVKAQAQAAASATARQAMAYVKTAASRKITDLADSAAQAASEAVDNAARRLANLRGRLDETLAGSTAEVKATTPMDLKTRLTRLVDDARDGDPLALAAVTGTAVALVGLGAFAVVKAVRR